MRRILMILIYVAPLLCLGQEPGEDLSVRTFVLPDSVVKQGEIWNGKEALTLKKDMSGGLSTVRDSLPDIGLGRAYGSAVNIEDHNAPGTAFIPLWRNAGILATGERTVMPGLMQIDSGSIGLMQNLGNLSLYFGGVANKYGYFNGLHTQYGVNGMVRYGISPRFSVTGFGTYYFGRPPMMPNGLPMPPSMVGYFGVSSFGGYMSYQFNETFGMDVGAQAVQQFGTDKYRFEPIVTPTVKLGKVRVGLPVGQILHGIIRTQMDGRRGK